MWLTTYRLVMSDWHVSIDTSCSCSCSCTFLSLKFHIIRLCTVLRFTQRSGCWSFVLVLVGEFRLRCLSNFTEIKTINGYLEIFCLYRFQKLNGSCCVTEESIMPSQIIAVPPILIEQVTSEWLESIIILLSLRKNDC